jgi:hypothetical protein
MSAMKMVQAADMLKRASTPEDVFGVLVGRPAEQLKAVKRQYRKLVRLVYPDHAPPAQVGMAEAAFVKLSRLKSEADEAIRAGTYGCPEARTPNPTVVVRSKRWVYTVERALDGDDLAEHYWCRNSDDQPVVLKVARRPGENDLLQSEAQILRYLRTADRPEAKGFFASLPSPIETFAFREDGAGPRRTANVFTVTPGFYSLAEVQRAYPEGIAPKHMAWMWRRLLDVLGYAHARGVIHGAVLPLHIQVQPETHHLVLTGWCAAVKDSPSSGGHIPFMHTGYDGWYPSEVAAKQPPLPGTDLYLSARSMLAVMGKQPLPPRLRGFLNSCLLPPHQRPQDAWQLRREFTELIEELWGPRRFLPFTMPVR